jgi:hypothetical protein
MIRALVPLALLSSLGLVADDLSHSFQFDVHRIGPSFEGHFNGTQKGSRLDIDLKNDLGIQKEITKVGFGIEYQGPRFAVELSAEEQDYRGSKYLQRDIQIDGSTIHAGAVVDSTVKVTDYTLNWTIRPRRQLLLLTALPHEGMLPSQKPWNATREAMEIAAQTMEMSAPLLV